MNPQEYTLSRKDKKFLSALMFVHFSLVMLTVSLFGLYYKRQINDCQKIAKKIELAEWITDQTDKAKSEKKLESIKKSYKSQGVLAEEF